MTPETSDDRGYWLDILKHNAGFADPERWVEYARAHRFTKVRADKLASCPDCGGEAAQRIGQQVYYSTLMSLLRCETCGLVYFDTRIDPETVRGHFERAYKDETYFVLQRARIFDHIASVVDECAGHAASLIDVGGAEGHLLVAIRKRRPDLELTLNDISASACAFAADRFGLAAVCGNLAELSRLGRTFEVLSMIDVIYYEPDLHGMWAAIGALLAEGGTLILRVPNKFFVSSLVERLRSAITPTRQRAMSDSVALLNPEHIYVFTKPYLRQKLRRLGFRSVEFIPSPSLDRPKRGNSAQRAYYRLATALHRVTGSAFIATPAMVVVARR